MILQSKGKVTAQEMPEDSPDMQDKDYMVVQIICKGGNISMAACKAYTKIDRVDNKYMEMFRFSQVWLDQLHALCTFLMVFYFYLLCNTSFSHSIDINSLQQQAMSVLTIYLNLYR